ncbi:MAG: hypothetical protein OSA47_04115 [Novosphingopyxis baekryungensis]|nr:hypothetical protein [Novosphingopyxis baekryungensis]
MALDDDIAAAPTAAAEEAAKETAAAEAAAKPTGPTDQYGHAARSTRNRFGGRIIIGRRHLLGRQPG